jgi:DNA-binding transcriptional regulator YiaG
LVEQYRVLCYIDGMTSEEIRATRERLGMTRTQFARELDVSYQTVVRWETGKLGVRNPRIMDYALRYLALRIAARIVGRDPEELEVWLNE